MCILQPRKNKQPTQNKKKQPQHCTTFLVYTLFTFMLKKVHYEHTVLLLRQLQIIWLSRGSWPLVWESCKTSPPEEAGHVWYLAWAGKWRLPVNSMHTHCSSIPNLLRSQNIGPNLCLCKMTPFHSLQWNCTNKYQWRTWLWKWLFQDFPLSWQHGIFLNSHGRNNSNGCYIRF